MAILLFLVSGCLISTQVWMSFRGLYPQIKTRAGRRDAKVFFTLCANEDLLLLPHSPKALLVLFGGPRTEVKPNFFCATSIRITLSLSYRFTAALFTKLTLSFLHFWASIAENEEGCDSCHSHF